MPDPRPIEDLSFEELLEPLDGVGWARDPGDFRWANGARLASVRGLNGRPVHDVPLPEPDE